MTIDEDFNDLTGYSDIHFAFDVFVVDRIMLFFDGDMVVDLHGRNLPRSQFIGSLRKRQQKGFFLLKENT